MPLRGERLAVIAGDARDNLELALREALEVAVENQMIGVLVMLRVIDDVAEIVQQRLRYEQLPGLGGERDLLGQSVEQLRRQLGHVLAMPLTGPALPRERPSRVQPVDRARMLAGIFRIPVRHHREEQAVAEATAVDEDLLGAEAFRESRDGGRAPGRVGWPRA